MLANDPGSKAGIALFHQGELFDVASLNPWGRAPTHYASKAALLADRDGTELALVGEAWGIGGRVTAAMLEGLAATWGIVRREMLLVGTKEPRIWKIPTATWRTFHGGPVGQKYFDWKQWSIDTASALAERSISNDNAAEAYLIGFAGLHLPETLDRVSKRIRKRFGEEGAKRYRSTA